VLPLRPKDLADLAEQRVDVELTPRLPNCRRPRGRADLGGVDVRVVRDLLRGTDLAHLLGLRRNLAAETSSNTTVAISQLNLPRFATAAHIVPRRLRRRNRLLSCMLP
jgi:hypothetical protein